MEMKNVKSNITNSIFINNNCSNHTGAVKLTCASKDPDWCTHHINNSYFKDNRGSRGGAIFYDRLRPVLHNNVYINNTAPYGPNIASFPAKLKFIESTRRDLSITGALTVASG